MIAFDRRRGVCGFGEGQALHVDEWNDSLSRLENGAGDACTFGFGSRTDRPPFRVGGPPDRVRLFATSAGVARRLLRSGPRHRCRVGQSGFQGVMYIYADIHHARENKYLSKERADAPRRRIASGPIATQESTAGGRGVFEDAVDGYPRARVSLSPRGTCDDLP